jgi:hypothetical protein
VQIVAKCEAQEVVKIPKRKRINKLKRKKERESSEPEIECPSLDPIDLSS